MASVEHVRSIFETIKATHGFLKPSGAASELITRPEENADLVSQIRREIYSFPTEPFLYPDAIETVRAIRRRDPVSIWTDDYIERVLASGLFGEADESLKPLTLDTAVDKIPLLPGLFRRATNLGVSGIVVIDNNLEELRIAAEVAKTESSLPVQFVWRTHQVNTALPLDFPLRYLPLISINALSDVLDARIRRPSNGQLQWIMDFNETLLDTPSLEQAMYQYFATRLNGHLSSSSE